MCESIDILEDNFIFACVFRFLSFCTFIFCCSSLNAVSVDCEFIINYNGGGLGELCQSVTV